MKRTLTATLLTLPLLLSACTPDEATTHGYMEGEFVLLAPTTGGLLQALNVERGQTVEAGTALFALDLTELTAQRNAAKADIAQAEATVVETTREFKRVLPLSKQGAASQSKLDAARAARDGATARLEAAKQALIQLEKKLADAAPKAPTAGLIEDTFFRPGEFVTAGQPVLSLLPPENIKARFFVPQAEVPHLKVGQAVTLTCDGCAQPIAATINYISAEAEYTPPVIYSVGSRDKLMFMLEAKPNQFAEYLRPGLPVDVHWEQN